MLFSILYSGDLTAKEAVLTFLITTVVFIFSLAVHEFAHGLVAYKMGDNTPKLAGRLTVNPLKHLSTSGFLMFIVIGVGWAKPMPTNPLNYKKFRTGQRWVSVAGIIANFILGLASAVLFAGLFAIIGGDVIFAHEALEYLFMFLEYMMLINSCLVLFNIIPLFPLDGFNFVNTFFKKQDNKYAKFNYNYGTTLLYGIIIFSLFLELFTGIDIFSLYLTLIHRWVFMPLALLGVA